jgi:transcription elongation factor Elf1
MTKPLEKITKEYPKRGPLSQFRFEKSISFNCFRCGQSKTSKLLTIYNSDWGKRLCNGCYGRLLSIYDIKAGQTGIDVTPTSFQ